MASWVSNGIAERSITVYCLVRSTLVGFESHLSVFLREDVLLYTASIVASDLYFFYPSPRYELREDGTYLLVPDDPKFTEKSAYVKHGHTIEVTRIRIFGAFEYDLKSTIVLMWNP